jgi:hypothetical protein
VLTLQPFPWRRLTPNSALEHGLDAVGILLLRARDEAKRGAPPLTDARVRDGEGNFHRVPLDALGLTWVQAENGDGWMLRTKGAAVTMAQVASQWGLVVQAVSSLLGVDERILLATLACEVGALGLDAEGLVKAARTEKGYPRRTGENDSGDFDRDLEDWTQSRGAHSSHGVMQTLIATAVAVRPELFEGIEPSRYRTVLWDPAHAITCGAAYLATFPDSVRRDPLASRFQYAGGRIAPTAKERWGAALYDELVPLTFLAFWNDDACLRAGEAVTLPAATALTTTLRPGGNDALWLGVLGASGVAAFAAFLLWRRSREDLVGEDDEDDDFVLVPAAEAHALLGEDDEEGDDEKDDDLEDASRPTHGPFLLPARAGAPTHRGAA